MQWIVQESIEIKAGRINLVTEEIKESTLFQVKQSQNTKCQTRIHSHEPSECHYLGYQTIQLPQYVEWDKKIRKFNFLFHTPIEFQ